MKGLIVLIISACAQSVTVSTRELNDEECAAKFSNTSHYNETLGKCVVGFGRVCEEDWSSDEYQCGSGEHGECRLLWGDVVCACKEGYDRKIAEDTLPVDFHCFPKNGEPGQSCTIPDWSAYKSTCMSSLQCSPEGVCRCNGDWNTEHHVCFNDEYCRVMAGIPKSGWEGLQSANYRKEEGYASCTCGVGFPCPIPLLSNRTLLLLRCPENTILREGESADSGPTCECEEGLIPEERGKFCTTKKKYGDSCNRYQYQYQYGIDPCGHGTTCRDSKCQCQGKTFWEPAKGACVLPLGGWCYGRTEECMADTECSNGRCACKLGMQQQRGQGCVEIGSRGAHCSSYEAGVCKNFMECVWRQGDGKICDCDGVWDETKSICYSNIYCQATHFPNGYYERVSGSCKCPVGIVCAGQQLVKAENCPEGAIPSETGTTCECGQGMVTRNYGRQCVPTKQYGEECTAQDQCMDSSECMGGVCRCSAWMLWNKVMGQCVTKSGALCFRDECTPNAQCLESRCVCPDGYKETGTGECFGAYGTACKVDSTCSPTSRCMDGKCGCEDLVGQVYNPGVRECITLVGSICSPMRADNEAPLTNCAQGSTCDSDTKLCQCLEGTVPAQNNGRCFQGLKYGQNCTANECDPGKGLRCGGTGHCVCADSALVYNEEQETCLAPIGVKCGDFAVEDSCLPAANGQDGECEYYKLECEPGAECGGIHKVCQVSVQGNENDPAPRAPDIPQYEHNTTNAKHSNL